MYTLDASVVGRDFDPGDAEHAVCHELIAQLDQQAIPVIVPRLLLVEVAGLVRRLTRDPIRARLAVDAWRTFTHVQIVPLDDSLIDTAAEIAGEFEKIYRTAVGRVLDRMEVFGIRRMDQTTGRQRLSVAYITLETVNQAKQSPVEALALDDEARLLDQLLQEDPDSYAPVAAALSSQPGPVDRLLPAVRQMVVRGDAGSGKTTLLQWIAVRAARCDFPPILV